MYYTLWYQFKNIDIAGREYVYLVWSEDILLSDILSEILHLLVRSPMPSVDYYLWLYTSNINPISCFISLAGQSDKMSAKIKEKFPLSSVFRDVIKISSALFLSGDEIFLLIFLQYDC